LTSEHDFQRPEKARKACSPEATRARVRGERARAEARNRLKKEERARLKEVALEAAHTKTHTHTTLQESELGISFAPPHFSAWRTRTRHTIFKHALPEAPACPQERKAHSPMTTRECGYADERDELRDELVHNKQDCPKSRAQQKKQNTCKMAPQVIISNVGYNYIAATS
jgi:hypothetical protein